VPYELQPRFDELIVLRPRGLDYHLQFPGPGGAPAIAYFLPAMAWSTARSVRFPVIGQPGALFKIEKKSPRATRLRIS